MRRLLLALALLGTVLPAYALPAAWITAIATFFSVAPAAIAVIEFAVVLVGGKLLSDRARKKQREAALSSLKDRIITVRGASEARRMVLGRQRVGGVVAFIGSVGADKEWLQMVIALAAHQCEAIDQIMFDDKVVTLGGADGGIWVMDEPWTRYPPESRSESFTCTEGQTHFTLAAVPIPPSVYAAPANEQAFILGIPISNTPIVGVSGNIVTLNAQTAGTVMVIGYQTAPTKSYAWVHKFLGAPGQTVEAIVNASFPGEWDASHPMSGCAGISVGFRFSEDAMPTGLPEVSAIVRGAKCYDPRKDGTAGGTGSHRTNDPTTWEFTENPALLIGYAATSPLCGRQAWANVDIPAMATAANVCDTQVDYSTWGLLADNAGSFIGDENGNTIGV